MNKKTAVSRRQFLVSTSAAAVGAAALNGKTLSADKTPLDFQSSSGSSIPYSRQELLSEGRSQRTLVECAEVAFPLGGIGTEIGRAHV